MPFVITVAILSDMYAPFDDLADLIIKILFPNNDLMSLNLTEENIKDLKEIMEYINSLSITERKPIFTHSSLLGIIDKDLLKTICRVFDNNITLGLSV